MMRRCRREEGYGIDAEFYVGDSDYPKVVHENKPPRGQPSLWLDWIPTEDRKHLKWNGGGPFHAYVKWLEYLRSGVLRPAGYWIDGVVTWKGDETEDGGEDDTGRITAVRGHIEAQADGHINNSLAYDVHNIWGNSAYGTCWDHGFVHDREGEDDDNDDWDDDFGGCYDCPFCGAVRTARRLQMKNDDYYEGFGPDDPKPKAKLPAKEKRNPKVKREGSVADNKTSVKPEPLPPRLQNTHSYDLRKRAKPNYAEESL